MDDLSEGLDEYPDEYEEEGSMSGWTKGPWLHDECGANDANVYGQGGQAIAHVYCTDHPDGLANARLIAAAPEMVETLADLVRALEMDADDPHAVNGYDTARALLARVKGEGQ